MVVRKSKQMFSWFYYDFSIPYRQCACLQSTPGADHTPIAPSPYSAAGIRENRQDTHIESQESRHFICPFIQMNVLYT